MNPIFLGPLADIIKGVIGRIWPDPQQQADAQFKLAQLVQSGELATMANDTSLQLAQIGVDSTEAGSENLFKSGWRPFIGWTCGSSFAWNFVMAPAATWAVNAANASGLVAHAITFAPADMSQMTPVLFGLLGLGAMRTVEKLKGAA
jgi:hypothetical protein